MNIRLTAMTELLMRQFFQNFTYDPNTFDEPSECKTYRYSDEAADAFYQKHNKPDRRHFAVMYGDAVIGDLYLKHIDHESRSCTMSIHMMNDSVKNKGYGTIAEQLALEYAFAELQMESVYADALIRNKRSRHVLTKAGFKEIRQDGKYSYYVCCRDAWRRNWSF